MDEINLQSLLFAAPAAIVVSLIVQIVKGWIVERFIPVAAVLIGMALVLVASILLEKTSIVELGNAALTGFMAGASAIGLYDLTQRTVRGK